MSAHTAISTLEDSRSTFFAEEKEKRWLTVRFQLGKVVDEIEIEIEIEKKKLLLEYSWHFSFPASNSIMYNEFEP